MDRNSPTCSICCNVTDQSPSPQFDIETFLDIFSIPINLVNFPLKSISFCLLCSSKLDKLNHHLKLMNEFKQGILNQIHNTANSIEAFKRHSNISYVISKELKRREGIVIDELQLIKEEPIQVLNEPVEFQQLDQTTEPNTNSPQTESHSQQQLNKLKKEATTRIWTVSAQKIKIPECEIQKRKSSERVKHKIPSTISDTKNQKINDDIGQDIFDTNEDSDYNEDDDHNEDDKSDSDQTIYEEVPIKKRSTTQKKLQIAKVKKKRRDVTGIFPCDKCGKIFKRFRNLKSHQDFFHDRKYECVCELCGKTLSNKLNLTSHMNQIHYKSERFICETCGTVFYSQPHLTNHIYNFHRIPIEEKTCKICNKSFSSIEALRVHYKRKHMSADDRPLKCDFCPFTEHSQYRMKIHLKTHGEKTIPCKLEGCGKMFVSNFGMNRHFRLHGEKTVPCTFEGCGKKFTNNSEMNDHLRLHNPERPFKCNLCKSSFRTKYRLRRHKKNLHAIDE